MGKLVVLGPFAELSPGAERTVFVTPPRALVPKAEIRLDNQRVYRILAVLSVEGKLYYVVYETEKLDFYQPYLARLPAAAEEREELQLPRCPRCGSWRVEVEDGMYCTSCGYSDFWNVVTVWKRREPPGGVELVEGEGIYVPPSGAIFDWHSMAGHFEVREWKRLAEGWERLGNVEVSWMEFIGFIDESSWDEEPSRHGFAVYRRYTAPWGTSFSLKVRDLSDAEKEQLFEEADDFTRICLARELPKERAAELILKARLHEKYPWSRLVDEPRVKQAYVEHQRKLIREAFEKGDYERAVRLAVLLRTEAGYEDNEIRETVEKCKKLNDEERKRREEEQKRREEEARRKAVEVKAKVEEELSDFPVVVEVKGTVMEVRLSRFVDRSDFLRYVEKCKRLGARFDRSRNAWVLRIA